MRDFITMAPMDTFYLQHTRLGIRLVLLFSLLVFTADSAAVGVCYHCARNRTLVQRPPPPSCALAGPAAMASSAYRNTVPLLGLVLSNCRASSRSTCSVASGYSSTVRADGLPSHGAHMRPPVEPWQHAQSHSPPPQPAGGQIICYANL